MDKKNIENKKTIRKIALAMAGYSSASIFGPLIFFGIIGISLDRIFETKPIILLICVFIAFITSNCLLYKKTKIITKQFDDYSKKVKEQNTENKN